MKDQDRQVFDSLFREWVNSVSTGQTKNDVYSQLFELVKDQEFDRVLLLKEISKAFKSNIHSVRITLLNFIYHLLLDGFHCPEFFWVIVTSNILFDKQSSPFIDRISVCFIKTVGHELARNYLCYLLGTTSSDYYETILDAFYPIGHSVESLKIIEQVLGEPIESNLDLYEVVYREAQRSFNTNQFEAYMEIEKEYYLKFFRRGVSLPNPNINVLSEIALKEFS